MLTGAITPMVTPTIENARDVDTDALRSFTRFLVDGGVHALFPCGSLGEFSSLTGEQRKLVLETVVENSTDVPVLAGCGGTNVGDVVHYVDDAATAGADAAVVVTPYYLKTDGDGLVDFYERVLERTSLPIILYDIPQLTGNEFTLEAVTELAAHDDVIGIKDSKGNFTFHQQLVESTPDSFAVLQGLAELAVPSLDIGSNGFVAGPGNVYPKTVSTMYETYYHNRESAIELWKTIVNPIVAATKPLPTAVGLKYLLACRGRDVGGPFPPLSPPSESDRDRLEQCYQRTSQQYQESTML